jgi:hypothetical protein
VVLLRRPLAEVLASQAELLRRSGRASGAEDEHTVAAALAKHLDWLNAWVRAGPPSLRVLELDHGEVVRSPYDAAAALAAFLDRPLDVAAMAAAVDPLLHRQRVNPRRAPR